MKKTSLAKFHRYGFQHQKDVSLLKEVDNAVFICDFMRQKQQVEILWTKSAAELGRVFFPVLARITQLQQSGDIKKFTSACDLKGFLFIVDV